MMARSEPHDLAALANLANAMAEQAAALVVDGLASARTRVDTKSSATDMVTEMDHASEALIVSAIRTARPTDGIVGEEGARRRGTSGVSWLIDPIDGTTNYLYGYPGFAVSIAAQVDGDTVVGVVLDCLAAERFEAVRGHGARLNGSTITCSGQQTLSSALVATGFGYDAGRRRRQAQVLTQVLPEIRDIRRRGAASVDLCWVACGRVDAYWEVGLGPWDIAAGELIAREAGALTGSLDGGPAGSSTLAAPPALYDALFDLLRTAGAAEV